MHGFDMNIFLGVCFKRMVVVGELLEVLTLSLCHYTSFFPYWVLLLLPTTLTFRILPKISLAPQF